VGLLTLEFPYKESANIYWMGVKRAFQGQGAGSALIESAVACAQWKGLNTLTVETLSPVELDENYIKTISKLGAFMKNVGFSRFLILSQRVISTVWFICTNLLSRRRLA